MLDYRGLQALQTVIETQSFELAAKALCISQSAISQRLKSLEQSYGEPLLVRTLPYKPTPLAEYLLGHYKQVSMLEETLQAQLSNQLPNISIAINRDSLETWFSEVLTAAQMLKQIKLELIADDQEMTIDYLRKGLVTACLSTSSQALTACQVTPLGDMTYVLVASPDFVAHYFPKKIDLAALLAAPAVVFDSKDRVLDVYLQKLYGLAGIHSNYHLVPSVRHFKTFALQGYGYALIPKIDVAAELAAGQLLAIGKPWPMPLYWHSWQLESAAYKAFNQHVLTQAQRWLD